MYKIISSSNIKPIYESLLLGYGSALKFNYFFISCCWALPKNNQYNTIIRIKVESVKKNWNFKCIDWPQNLKSKSKAQIIQSNKYPMKK